MAIFILGSYAKALVMTTERIPLVGETLIGDDFRQTFGGKGSDMAVQAARLGPTYFILAWLETMHLDMSFKS
ncbi:ribokinase [Vibrio variabilis]|uniref:Ribokinase n=1 Tax=Vibrio variabilis TaxID=990271 RepID=A0ABQ0J6N5_9VIBR|nr:ribokinase [Vibrio variabilis]